MATFEALKNIIENYDVGHFLDYDLIHDGIENKVYKIYTKNKIFILRKNERNLINKNIKFETELIKTLNNYKFNAPKLIINKEKRAETKINNKTYCLFQYIEGKQFDKVNKKNLIEAGAKALGKFHRLTSNLKLKGKPKRNLFTEIKRFQKIKNPPFKGSAKISKEINDFYQEAKKKKTNYGIIHNDYHSNNLIYKNEKQCYLIDFDWACYGPLIKDLALALGLWPSHITGKEPPNKNILKHFLKSYNQTAPYKVNYDKELLFWICFSLVSETATFFADVTESKHSELNIKDIEQCFSYRKFKYFWKEFKQI